LCTNVSSHSWPTCGHCFMRNWTATKCRCVCFVCSVRQGLQLWGCKNPWQAREYVNHTIHKLRNLPIMQFIDSRISQPINWGICQSIHWEFISHRLQTLPITQSIDWYKDVTHPHILISTVIYCYSFLLLTTITMECTLLFHNRWRYYCFVWIKKPRTFYN